MWTLIITLAVAVIMGIAVLKTVNTIADWAVSIERSLASIAESLKGRDKDEPGGKVGWELPVATSGGGGT